MKTKKSLSLLFILITCVACSSGISINEQAYYFERLNLEALWEHSTGESQVIAIIDTGITDDALEFYQDNIIDVYNSIDGSQNVLDENEYTHGTQMASIMIGNGEADVFGIAPDARLIIIKAFEGSGAQSSGEALAHAVDYATLQEVDIISLSFGSFQENEQLKESIDRAIESNITVVAATGDYGNNDALFPASMANTVSVRAKDYNGEFWVNSNIDENDTMSMYGVDIKGLTLGNELIEMSGTSHATALASGYIALIRDFYYQKNISFSNEDILKLLESLESNTQTDVDYLAPFQQLKFSSDTITSFFLPIQILPAIL